MRGLIVRRRHADQIRAGEKTQTRRIHSRPFRVNETLRLKRSYTLFWPGGILIRILSVRQERLGDCDEVGAQAEGFKSLRDFKAQYETYTGQPWRDETVVTVYTFEVTSKPLFPARGDTAPPGQTRL